MSILPSAIPTDKIPSQEGAVAIASLVLIHPPMPDLGLRRPLCQGVVVVGRDESADFTVARSSISRRHAELRCSQSGDWVVADMGSTNGTFLNEQQVDDAPLQNGDHIQFGDAIFKFVSGSSAAYHDKVHGLTVLDGLTSLFNQTYFNDLVEEQMARASKVSSDMALIVFDVDGLGDLNEEYGQSGGDVILRNVAKQISSVLKSSHTAARIVGGEFAIFAPGLELAEAKCLADEVRDAISSKHYSLVGDDLSVSVSVGIAASAEGELQAGQIVAEAQSQLLAAKERGGDCICP